MFDLDNAIKEWRQEMTVGGVTAAEALDELESHLRDDVVQQAGGGASVQEVFESSVARLGQAALLRTEFDKVGGARAGRERIRHAFLTLAGIPNSYLESNMNTSNPNIEPRWATYLKAAVFLAPAFCLWTLSAVFLIPKLQQVCKEAGVAIPSAYRMTAFIADHTVFIGLAVILSLAMLEWRSIRWPQYRRALFGGAVFLVNTAVLALITWMVVLALLAAPTLMHHAH